MLQGSGSVSVISELAVALLFGIPGADGGSVYSPDDWFPFLLEQSSQLESRECPFPKQP
jgi:hypothetical protein